MPDIVSELFAKHQAELGKHLEKYRPLVANITDMEFAGLYQAVLEERSIRMALIATNPMIRNQILRDMAARLPKEDSDHDNT